MDNSKYQDIVNFLRDQEVPETCKNKSNFKRDCKKYSLENGRLLRNDKIVLKEEDLEDVWFEHHVQTLHPGKKKVCLVFL